MMQTLINLLLGLGYVVGLILVWIGLEMYVVDGRRFAPAFLSIVVGVGLWSILVAAGKAFHRQAVRRMETQR
jgi:predicted tellurium resistance membrane protein TerC